MEAAAGYSLTAYDTLKGRSGWSRRKRALDAHVANIESIESWTREVDKTIGETINAADKRKDDCMADATRLATVEGMTKTFQRVLGGMWAVSKTTSICWASHETLALIAECSIKTVQRAQKLFRALKIIRFKGYHSSGTCMWSFADLGMSDKLSFAFGGDVFSIVRRLLDVDGSPAWLPSESTRSYQKALEMPDRAPP